MSYVKNIAIVGAGGNSGKYITEALLKTGKHTVTAISRVGSTSALPSGIAAAKQVNYDNHEDLVQALTGQEALIITLSGTAPATIEPALIRAAVAAGVTWIVPNGSADITDEALFKELPALGRIRDATRQIEESGSSAYLSLSTGFWYEWSVSLPFAYGFDFKARAVTLFDEGNVRIRNTTWPQLGRAYAALFSLPAAVESFFVSQRDIFESVLRVTSTAEADWKVIHQPSALALLPEKEMFMRGEMAGWGLVLYSFGFFPDEKRAAVQSETVNKVLGLPQESLDEMTKVAIERASKLPF
ncbi:hypothetical protein HK405_002864 [Cladochytrium tenue]|nr:hypothetical protein HK405_002864 [Cladochytrium tenue]